MSNDATNAAAVTRKLSFGPKFQNLGRPNEADERDDALRGSQRLQEAGRRRRKTRAAATVRPLPVVASRGSAGFKRRRLLLLDPV